jgi:glutathione peroxidase
MKLNQIALPLFAVLALASAATADPAKSTAKEPIMSLHELTADLLNGTPQPLSTYKGKVVLVVNTASECGYTPQYAGLEKLYESYKDKGFVILGFPSNDFGAQEPGSATEIATFCKKNYGVTFPMFSKVATKGADQSPVYKFLAPTDGGPKWNFHKYLVGKDGKILHAYPSKVAPESADLHKDIDAALAAK